jgi:hypothetical protein
MDVNAPRLAFRLRKQHRLLAEDEHGGAAEEMRGNDRPACRNCARVIDD